MFKAFAFAVGLSLAAVPLASCNGANVTAALTAPVPITTLSEAIHVDSIAVTGLDTYVKTGNPSPATLQNFAKYANAVHDQLKLLEDAQAAGRPLSFVAFQAAFKALNDFANTNGIKLPTS